MTSGTWDRHRGHAAGYDVVDLGFNYRLDEPRAALLLGTAAGPGGRHRRAGAALCAATASGLGGLDGLTVPYRDDEVERSSCYVMPVLVDDAELRDPLRRLLLESTGCRRASSTRRSTSSPPIADLAGGGLTRSELVARCELTLPLFPHLSEAEQDRVIAAWRRALPSRASAPPPRAETGKLRAEPRESPSLRPALAAVAVFTWLAADQAGDGKTTWYPAGSILLGLLGIAVVALPRPRPSRRTWIAVALLGAYAAWSYLLITWPGQKDVARDGAICTLVHAVVLALSPYGRSAPVRPPWCSAGAAGLAVVGLVTLLRATAPTRWLTSSSRVGWWSRRDT